MDTATLKLPIAMLVAEGKLEKAGVARGTNYTVGGGGRWKKAARKAGQEEERSPE